MSYSVCFVADRSHVKESPGTWEGAMDGQGPKGKILNGISPDVNEALPLPLSFSLPHPIHTCMTKSSVLGFPDYSIFGDHVWLEEDEWSL